MKKSKAATLNFSWTMKVGAYSCFVNNYQAKHNRQFAVKCKVRIDESISFLACASIMHRRDATLWLLLRGRASSWVPPGRIWNYFLPRTDGDSWNTRNKVRRTCMIFYFWILIIFKGILSTSFVVPPTPPHPPTSAIYPKWPKWVRLGECIGTWLNTGINNLRGQNRLLNAFAGDLSDSVPDIGELSTFFSGTFFSARVENDTLCSTKASWQTYKRKQTFS